MIVLATYWNEIDWIELSLRQIDELDAEEVIVCEGCFDPKYPIRSTDGTRECIEEWAAKRNEVTIVSAMRVARWKTVSSVLRGAGPGLSLSPARLVHGVASLRKSRYRINQAYTFSMMIRHSRLWRPGAWYMTIDADQYYPKDMISRFRNLCTPESDVGLLTASERTFISDFQHYTTDYEKRPYNNMPHRIHSRMFVRPTRDVLIDSWFRTFKHIEYYRTVHVGEYFHYKFRPGDPNRTALTYAVGDRASPEWSEYALKEFSGRHPFDVDRAFAE